MPIFSSNREPRLGKFAIIDGPPGKIDYGILIKVDYTEASYPFVVKFISGDFFEDEIVLKLSEITHEDDLTIFFEIGL